MDLPLNASVRVFQEKAFLILFLLLFLLLFDPFLPPSVTPLSFLGIAVGTAWLESSPGSISRKAILALSCAVAALLVFTRAIPVHPTALVRESIGITLLLLALALYVLCAGLILGAILKARNVTHNLIVSAVNIYLLIGVCWAYLYTLLDRFDPSAFALGVHQADSPSHFIYFSFVTLASLGYGDITPKTELAQRLAIIEAVMGQFYGSIVVAYLVSVYIGQQIRGNDSHSGNDSNPTD
jgi:hypothetical protein